MRVSANGIASSKTITKYYHSCATKYAVNLDYELLDLLDDALNR